MQAQALAEAAKERQAPTACAGNITAKEAWTLLKDDATAQLVDVRTPPEWGFVCLPNLSSLNRQPLTLSWKLYPNFATNPDFVAQLQSAVPDKNTPLLFLCKTGGRSLDAACAMTEAGYRFCFNIEDGFEGAANEAGQRGTVSGWKASQLPWEQA